MNSFFLRDESRTTNVNGEHYSKREVGCCPMISILIVGSFTTKALMVVEGKLPVGSLLKSVF